jgi:hypothetical protein
MRRLILLAIMAALTCCRRDPHRVAADSASAQPSSRPKPPKPVIDDAAIATLGLGDALANDVRTLALAREYGGIAVGVGGSPTDEYEAMLRLSAAEGGTKGLLFVIDHGTLEGQLMALTALYEVDRAEFDKLAPRYENRKEGVYMHLTGCGPDPITSVGQLLETRGAVRLKGPTDTLSAWHKRNPDVVDPFYDIKGGAYPSMFFARRRSQSPSAVSSAAPVTSGSAARAPKK